MPTSPIDREAVERLLSRYTKRRSSHDSMVPAPVPAPTEERIPTVHIPASDKPISPYFVEPLPPVKVRPWLAAMSLVESTIWFSALLARFPDHEFIESLKRPGKPRVYIFKVGSIKVAMTAAEAITKLRKAGVRRW